jgi:hypothetical protein
VLTNGTQFNSDFPLFFLSTFPGLKIDDAVSPDPAPNGFAVAPEVMPGRLKPGITSDVTHNSEK